jgi:hypothetical protein
MMLYITSALLAFTALTAIAHPHPRSDLAHEVKFVDTALIPRGMINHVKLSPNTSLTSRAAKGVCTTTDLPTKASYKLGYETFCNGFGLSSTPAYIKNKPLVGTVLIPSYSGGQIAWVFKVSSEKWSGAIASAQYTLSRDTCISKFRDVLDGEASEAGKTYCVVAGTGGNDSGEGGEVLVMGGTAKDYPWGPDKGNASFETRRRKGEFSG